MPVTISSRHHSLAKSPGNADTITRFAEPLEDIEKLKVSSCCPDASAGSLIVDYQSTIVDHDTYRLTNEKRSLALQLAHEAETVSLEDPTPPMPPNSKRRSIFASRHATVSPQLLPIPVVPPCILGAPDIPFPPPPGFILQPHPDGRGPPPPPGFQPEVAAPPGPGFLLPATDGTSPPHDGPRGAWASIMFN
nr:P30 adhesin-like [Rhipicephalus microplus]